MPKIFRPLNNIKEVPALVAGKVCPVCDTKNVLAAHFKSIGKKKLKAGEAENPCQGSAAEKRMIQGSEWHLPLRVQGIQHLNAALPRSSRS